MATIVQGRGKIKDGTVYPNLLKQLQYTLLRVFPCPLRHSDSSNYSPFKYFLNGCQYVALNNLNPM